MAAQVRCAIRCRSINCLRTNARRRILTSAAASTTMAAPPSLAGFVDTHTHLDLIMKRMKTPTTTDANAWYTSFKSALPKEQMFEKAITVGCSVDTFDAVENFIQNQDDVYGAFGIHPLNAADWSDETEARIKSIFERNPAKAVAWGECGLDYHYCDEPEEKSKQRDVFVRQLDIAAELGLPLVVHTREAEEDTLALMSEHLPRDQRIHVHCFTSSVSMAKSLLDLFPTNLCIGFTGVITFKNASEVRDVVAEVPLDRILLETDGPYMAPTPFRGKVAHPGHVYYVAQKVSEVKGAPLEEVLATCRANTTRVYGI